MSANFKISPKATEDLEKIWRYTYFHWSENQADKYYNLIMEKIKFLSQNQISGKNIDYVKSGYWQYSVQSHIIFYKIISGKIEIIRILHNRMNIPNILKD